MRLKNEDYEEIKQIVVDTFEIYGIGTVPISAFEMAIKMGLKLIPYSGLNLKQQNAALRISQDGFSVELQSGEWQIYYNDECYIYGRLNHTIMHEIGHYALGHCKEGEREEAEAKFFAKYALAPPPLVHNMKRPICVSSVKDTFALSHEGAKIACGYYDDWLKYGDIYYTDYEKRMMSLFSVQDKGQ